MINDPSPMFGLEPKHDKSQICPIKFSQLLKDFSFDAICNNELQKFDNIGFSRIGKNKYNLVNAFSRSHVFGCILLNLRATQKIDYEEQMWAMEDFSFNLRINERWTGKEQSRGVIIKCLRYLAYKR